MSRGAQFAQECHDLSSICGAQSADRALRTRPAEPCYPTGGEKFERTLDGGRTPADGASVVQLGSPTNRVGRNLGRNDQLPGHPPSVEESCFWRRSGRDLRSQRRSKGPLEQRSESPDRAANVRVDRRVRQSSRGISKVKAVRNPVTRMSALALS